MAASVPSRHLPREEPPAAQRDPGARPGAVPHAVRPAVVPPGLQRRRLPGARPPTSRSASIVVQPARGLIVDDMGRPLVANRTSWVVTVDRTLLQKMDADAQERLLRRIAGAVGPALPATIQARTLLCGEPGSERRHLLERLAVPAGPGRQGHPAADRAVDHGAERGLPGGHRRGAERPRLPRRRTASTPRTCSATSARSPRPSSTRRRTRTTPRCTAPRSSAAPGWRSSTTSYLRGFPGYKQVAVDSMGRVLGDSGEIAGPRRRHAGHLHRRPRAGRRRAAARARRSRPPATTIDTVTGRQYVADSGAAVVMEADTGRIVAMASQPTYDPSVWVGGITPKELDRLYSEEAGTPLLSAPPRASSRPGRPGSRS